MPRSARNITGGVCYHVLNRAVSGLRPFEDDRLAKAFIGLMADACRRVPIAMLAYVLMPDHLHLIARPERDGDLSAWMRWLLTTHVRRHHAAHGTAGHIWQGRYRAFPIQEDRHLLTVLRYVERNPQTAGLVARARDWPWSSLAQRLTRADQPLALAPSPVPLPADWPALVETPLSAAELAAVREAARRGRPFGDRAWTEATAARLGLESSLRPRGRPSGSDARGPRGG